MARTYSNNYNGDPVKDSAHFSHRNPLCLKSLWRNRARILRCNAKTVQLLGLPWNHDESLGLPGEGLGVAHARS
jgi:hypothetical protein